MAARLFAPRVPQGASKYVNKRLPCIPRIGVQIDHEMSKTRSPRTSRQDAHGLLLEIFPASIGEDTKARALCLCQWHQTRVIESPVPPSSFSSGVKRFVAARMTLPSVSVRRTGSLFNPIVIGHVENSHELPTSVLRGTIKMRPSSLCMTAVQ